MIFDNSVEGFQLIVERISDEQPNIYNQVIWYQICRIEP
jgi:hypothetical protein